MARPAKFDYDNDEFYKRISSLALQGLTDAEIAVNLSVEKGGALTPEVFCRMKSGCYEGWNKRENKKRSERLSQVLTQARNRINGIVRGAYLKGALGGKKVKMVTKRFVQSKCNCNGENQECPRCGGTGWTILTDKAIMQETETELPPNMQALATWLYHHDLEWRAVQRKQDADLDDSLTEGSIDIAKWIKNNTDD